MGCVGGVVAATGVVWDTAGARGLGDIPEGVVGGGGVVAPKGVCLGGRACGSVVAGELAAAGDGKCWMLKDTSESSICVRTFAADLTMSPIASSSSQVVREKYSGEVIRDRNFRK